MSACFQCGKKIGWFDRVAASVGANGHEFCRWQCRDEWLSATEAEAAKPNQAPSVDAVATFIDPKELASQAAKKGWETRKRRQRNKKEKDKQLKEEAKRLEEEEARRFDEENGVQELAKRARQARDDPHPHLDLARTYARLSFHRKKALSSFEAALALGVPSGRDSAEARWDYAEVLITIGRKLTYRVPGERSDREYLASSLSALARKHHAALPAFRRALFKAAPDVAHQLRVAMDDLKRHLRNDPDDSAALRLIIKVSKIFGRDAAKWQDQLRLAKKRASLAGAKKRAGHAQDRSGIAFEERCLSVVGKLGFKAVTTSPTADGGIDILAMSDRPLLRGRVAIQCKDWQGPVGEPELRDLLGVVTAEHALKGILITSSTFTPAALQFAEGQRLELIDGKELAALEQLPSLSELGGCAP